MPVMTFLTGAEFAEIQTAEGRNSGEFSYVFGLLFYA